jgi:hypothetical protein
MPELRPNFAPPAVVSSKGRARFHHEKCQSNSNALTAPQSGDHSKEVM